MKDIFVVECKKCGYEKMVQLDANSIQYPKIKKAQTNKPCPNCGSSFSLEQKDKLEFCVNE